MATISDMAFVQARLMALFPNYHPADLSTVATIWLEILGDMPADLLKMSVMQYASESHEFAPSAGTVRDYAIRLQIKAAGTPDAYRAYDEVCNKSSLGEKCGEFQQFPDGHWDYPRKPIQWSHPLVEAVANSLGWPERFPTDKPGVDLGQFIRAYESQLSKQMTDAARLPVVQKFIEAQQAALPAANELAKRLEMK